jgi:hypothetical protein
MKQYKLKNLVVTEMTWQEYLKLKKQKYERSNRNKHIKGKAMLDGRRKVNGFNGN